MRPRVVLVIAVSVLVAAAGVWLATSIVPSTRISWGDEEGGPIVTVSAELPAGTCSKVLSPRFPWVRIRCEQDATPSAAERSDPASEPAGDEVPGDLDSASDAE